MNLKKELKELTQKIYDNAVEFGWANVNMQVCKNNAVNYISIREDITGEKYTEKDMDNAYDKGFADGRFNGTLKNK